MSDLGDKLPEEDRTPVEDAIAELKTAMEGDDAEEIKNKTNVLQEASMKIGEHMYRMQQEKSAEGGEDATGADDADVTADADASSSDEPEIVDAEFTEVDEDDDDKKSGTAWSDYL